MKIDGSNAAAALTATTGGASTSRNVKEESQQGSPKTQDNVTLSSTSAQMQALSASINDASEVDTAKVQAVKQAIEAGTFKVDAEAIANKLIASAREMLASNGRS